MSTADLPAIGSAVVHEELKQQLTQARKERDAFASEQEKLKEQLRQEKVDSMHAVGRLQDQLTDLTASNKALNDKVAELQGKLSQRESDLRSEAEKKLSGAQRQWREKEAQLMRQNQTLLDEITDLRAFKQERSKLLQELSQTKDALESQKLKHGKDIRELERAFLSTRERMEEEAALNLAQSQKAFKKEAYRDLDKESLVLRRENARMVRELRFHEDTSDTLQQQNSELRKRIAALERAIELHEDKEVIAAKKGVRQKKTMQELSEKVRTLERALNQTLRDDEVQHAQVHDTHQRVVTELKQEMRSLQHALKLKTRELKHIKKLSRTILDQRKEMEQFFLEALEQVKEEVRQKRVEEYKKARSLYNQQLRDLASKRGVRLPSLRSAPELSSPKRNQRVHLSDLSLEDRERVLRLLFSKINGSTVAHESQLPAHSFDVPTLPPALPAPDEVSTTFLTDQP